jgi:hypothetical protein
LLIHNNTRISYHQHTATEERSIDNRLEKENEKEEPKSDEVAGEGGQVREEILARFPRKQGK